MSTTRSKVIVYTVSEMEQNGVSRIAQTSFQVVVQENLNNYSRDRFEDFYSYTAIKHVGNFSKFIAKQRNLGVLMSTYSVVFTFYTRS